jgi:hypothetical protein
MVSLSSSRDSTFDVEQRAVHVDIGVAEAPDYSLGEVAREMLTAE